MSTHAKERASPTAEALTLLVWAAEGLALQLRRELAGHAVDGDDTTHPDCPLCWQAEVAADTHALLRASKSLVADGGERGLGDLDVNFCPINDALPRLLALLPSLLGAGQGGGPAPDAVVAQHKETRR